MWDGTENGGFTDGKPWIPLHSGYKRYNLKRDINAQKSVFGFYKRLLQIKKENPALIYGDFELVSGKDDRYFIFKRKYESDCVTVICNFEDEIFIDADVADGSIILSNYKEHNSNSYKPYEIRVYK